MTARLSEVGEVLGADLPPSAASLEVVDVEHDSRRVTEGALFCCAPGAQTDGHDHAAAAVEAGAVALLVERPVEVAVPQLRVDVVRRAMAPAAALVHGHPSGRLDVVGVTGTNGKTTTVRLVAAAAERLGRRTREIGTLTGVRTTPEAPELQRTLAGTELGKNIVLGMNVALMALTFDLAVMAWAEKRKKTLGLG